MNSMDCEFAIIDLSPRCCRWLFPTGLDVGRAMVHVGFFKKTAAPPAAPGMPPAGATAASQDFRLRWLSSVLPASSGFGGAKLSLSQLASLLAGPTFLCELLVLLDSELHPNRSQGLRYHKQLSGLSRVSQKLAAHNLEQALCALKQRTGRTAGVPTAEQLLLPAEPTAAALLAHLTDGYLWLPLRAAGPKLLRWVQAIGRAGSCGAALSPAAMTPPFSRLAAELADGVLLGLLCLQFCRWPPLANAQRQLPLYRFPADIGQRIGNLRAVWACLQANGVPVWATAEEWVRGGTAEMALLTLDTLHEAATQLGPVVAHTDQLGDPSFGLRDQSPPTFKPQLPLPLPPPPPAIRVPEGGAATVAAPGGRSAGRPKSRGRQRQEPPVALAERPPWGANPRGVETRSRQQKSAAERRRRLQGRQPPGAVERPEVVAEPSAGAGAVRWEESVVVTTVEEPAPEPKLDPDPEPEPVEPVRLLLSYEEYLAGLRRQMAAKALSQRPPSARLDRRAANVPAPRRQRRQQVDPSQRQGWATARDERERSGTRAGQHQQPQQQQQQQQHQHQHHQQQHQPKPSARTSLEDFEALERATAAQAAVERAVSARASSQQQHNGNQRSQQPSRKPPDRCQLGQSQPPEGRSPRLVRTASPAPAPATAPHSPRWLESSRSSSANSTLPAPASRSTSADSTSPPAPPKLKPRAAHPQPDTRLSQGVPRDQPSSDFSFGGSFGVALGSGLLGQHRAEDRAEHQVEQHQAPGSDAVFAGLIDANSRHAAGHAVGHDAEQHWLRPTVDGRLTHVSPAVEAELKAEIQRAAVEHAAVEASVALEAARQPVAVLGYDTTGNGRLDYFDTNQVGYFDTRAAAGAGGDQSFDAPCHAGETAARIQDPVARGRLARRELSAQCGAAIQLQAAQRGRTARRELRRDQVARSRDVGPDAPAGRASTAEQWVGQQWADQESKASQWEAAGAAAQPWRLFSGRLQYRLAIDLEWPAGEESEVDEEEDEEAEEEDELVEGWLLIEAESGDGEEWEPAAGGGGGGGWSLQIFGPKEPQPDTRPLHRFDLPAPNRPRALLALLSNPAAARQQHSAGRCDSDSHRDFAGVLRLPADQPDPYGACRTENPPACSRPFPASLSPSRCPLCAAQAAHRRQCGLTSVRWAIPGFPLLLTSWRLPCGVGSNC